MIFDYYLVFLCNSNYRYISSKNKENVWLKFIIEKLLYLIVFLYMFMSFLNIFVIFLFKLGGLYDGNALIWIGKIKLIKFL